MSESAQKGEHLWSYEISSLPGRSNFGAVVTGLSLEELADSSTRIALLDLWVDKGVIVFRDMGEDVDTLLSLSEIFGRVVEHPLLVGTNRPRAHRLVMDIKYDPQGR